MAAISVTELNYVIPDKLSCTGKVHLLDPIGRIKNVEAERIQRVILNGIKRYEEVLALFCIISDDKKLFSIKDVDLRQLILKHQFMVKGSNSGEILNVDINDSLRDVFRYTEYYGIQLTSCVTNDITKEASNFIRSLNELSSITQNKLLTEKMEIDRQNMQQLKIMERTRESKATIDFLSKFLERKIEKKDMELMEQNRQIQEMTHDINLIKLSSTDRNNKTINDATKQVISIKMSSRGQETRIKQEIVDMETIETNEVRPNIASEARLRKRKTKMQIELANWIEKYDDSMEKLQEELEGLQSEHDKEVEKLKDTQKYFSEIKIEYDVIIENQRLKEEEEERLQEEFERMTMSAKKVQAVWRGYLLRKRIMQSNKKKVKKGKKKKKK